MKRLFARDAVDSEPVNAVAWVFWFVALALPPLTTRNPLYLALAFLIACVVYLSLPKRGAAARAWRLFLGVGLTLTVFSVAFNVLTVHVGDRVFGRIPSGIPIIGGNLTWNAVAYGLVSAMAIATLLVGAATFNTAVRHGDLVRLMPGSLARLGIAGSIALTMVPQTVAAGRDIIEAQRARGHRLRSVRDASSLLVPLLAVGLERAVTLSEALEVRGFGAPATGVVGRGIRRRLLLLCAGLALLAALLALGMGRVAPGVAALGLALLCGVQATPVAARRTRLRPVRWNAGSLFVLGGSGWALLGFTAVTVFTGAELAWDTFPRIGAPPFEPVIGLALLGLLCPALASGGQQ